MAKTVETFVVHQMGGAKVRLVPETEIIAYLRSLTKCPCCGTRRLKEVRSTPRAIPRFVCPACGFEVWSNSLFNDVNTNKKRVDISKVLEPLIRQEIKEHRKKLRDEMTGLINSKLVPIAQQLELCQAQADKEGTNN